MARLLCKDKPKLIGAVVFTIIYIASILTHQALDLWNTQYNISGFNYIVYNFIRCIFMFYFVMMMAGTALVILKIFSVPMGKLKLSFGEFFVANFFIGASIWTIFMFFAGICGGYYKIPIFLLTVGPVFVSYRFMSDCLALLFDKIRFTLAGLLDVALIVVPLFAFVVFLTLLVFSDALSVGSFGIDSSHYLAYYEQVVVRHGTSPNELWYHFWITKGAGLYFLGLILLDIQSPQLISTVFLIMTSALIYVFARRICREGFIIGLFFSFLFLAPFVSAIVLHQKLHFITAGFVAALIWILCLSSDRATPEYGIWVGISCLMSVAVVLLSPPIAPLLGMFFTLIVLYEVILKKAKINSDGNISILLPVSVMATYLFILTLNYIWTGLAEITPFKLFFNHANQDRLSAYVSPYLLIFLNEWVPKNVGAFTPENIFNININWQKFLYINALPGKIISLLLPLFTVAISLFIFRDIRRKYLRFFIIISLFMLCSLILSRLASQPGSIERFYVFNYPLLLMMLIIIASTILYGISKLPIFRKEIISAIFVSLVAIIWTINGLGYWLSYLGKHGGGNSSNPPSPVGFLLGKYSFYSLIDESKYNTKPSCTVFSRVANNESLKRPLIWTLPMLMEVGCYILPTSRIMMEVSNKFGNNWHRVVFGPELDAKKELAKAGVSFFYIDLASADIKKDKFINSSLFGCLAYSELFRPASIMTPAI